MPVSSNSSAVPLHNQRGSTCIPIDPLLTDRESAALLRVAVSTFRRYVARGLVQRPMKLGGTSRWAQSDILAVIEAAKAQRDTARQIREDV